MLVPKDYDASLMLLIGVPYWPGKSVIKSIRQNLAQEAALKHGAIWWLRRSWWATIYAFKRATVTYKVLNRRRMSDFRLPKPSKGTKILLLRNQKDPFTHPDIRSL